MTTVEKLSIALTPDMVSVVRKAVESGGYASNSEVIREALRDWQIKQVVRQQQVEDIRRLWEEGIASGPSVPFDVEALKAEARRRSEEKKAGQ